ncbi:MAG TPA: Crp/Fnr family transcriptional regulator [Pyrinomonadaceae bacterium]|nr:Crp/Fnr family transcriptional regulator [Pyrinomonadaceae bacterium]
MPLADNLSPPIANRLLAALPVKEYRRLLPQLERFTMPLAEVLYEPGDPIRHVYFPNDSIVSLLSVVAERSTLEVGLVGNEGMAGIPVFMGVGTSRNRALVQGAGTAMRMKAAALRTESERLGPLHRLLRRYSHSLLTQVAQTAACNRFHMVDARLARWLLMTHDRSQSDEFHMTQEFMSNMLGVRREGVNKAATALQRDELISYSRGHVRVLDRAGLEAVSCECYRVIKEESASRV